MQVNKDEVAVVFAALGVGGAYTWDADQLTKKVNAKGGIAAYLKKGHEFTVSKLGVLFKQIDDAQEAGVLVRVVDGPAAKLAKAKVTAKPVPVKAAPKAKPALKPKATPKAKRIPGKPGRPLRGTPPVAPEDVKYLANGRPALGSPMWAFREYFAKHPSKVSDRGPGVMRTLIDELKRAGKAGSGGIPAPITRDELLAVLTKEFPARPSENMRMNMNNLVSSKLRDEFGIHVWVTPPDVRPRGYYIVGDGDKPQSKSKTAGR